MNIENLDYFLNELTEEELKSCTGGSVLDSAIDGTQNLAGYNVDNAQNTINYNIDRTQEGSLNGIPKDARAIVDIVAG